MISALHLRRMLHGTVLAVTAIAVVMSLAPRESAAQRSSDTTWFEEPCLPDSADSFFWTRYDLHGVRIRIPPGARHVKYPSVDELHFRLGEATLRLRLHRDASALFARYYTPERKRRHCEGDIGGLLAEAISFGAHPFYGFAVRWPDADRGEWLAAVIQGSRLTEVTQLRRALFTIVFPDERRQGEAMGFWVNDMWGHFNRRARRYELSSPNAYPGLVEGGAPLADVAWRGLRARRVPYEPRNTTNGRPFGRGGVGRLSVHSSAS